MGVKERIESIVAPLWEEHEALAGKRDELRAELGTYEEQIKQLEKVLRAADPDNPLFLKTPTDSNGYQKNISEDKLELILAAMWERSDRAFSEAQLQETLGISQSTVHYGLKELRARGQVRAIGRVADKAGRKGAMGFKVVENATLPQRQPKREVPAKEIRDKISEQRVAYLLEAAKALPQPFTRVDLKAALPDVSRSAVDFGVRVLEMDGTIEMISEMHGNHPATYRVTDAQ